MHIRLLLIIYVIIFFKVFTFSECLLQYSKSSGQDLAILSNNPSLLEWDTPPYFQDYLRCVHSHQYCSCMTNQCSLSSLACKSSQHNQILCINMAAEFLGVEGPKVHLKGKMACKFQHVRSGCSRNMRLFQSCMSQLLLSRVQAIQCVCWECVRLI